MDASDTLVGQATADVKTTKDVLVRLRAPRFFVEGDSITVAALVNNRTDKAQSARVKIALDDGTSRPRSPLEVDGRGRGRTRTAASTGPSTCCAPGETKIAAQVVAQADQDALEMTFPVLEWGHDKVLTQGAVLENDATPRAHVRRSPRSAASRRPRSSSRCSRASRSMLLDALPYLVDFPYGCTEQTTSRFIPAAIVAKVLGDAGVTLEDIAAARGGAAKQRERDHARVLTSAELQTRDPRRASTASPRCSTATAASDGGRTTSPPPT